MMKLKPYPKYKDSGIQWIGKIPEGWEVRRIRFNCQVNPTEKKYVTDEEQKVSFLPMEKVSENGEFDYESIADYNDVSSGYTYFQNKDVIVAKITPCFENGKGALVDNLLNGFGFGTTEFHVLRSNKEIEPKYLYYFTFSHLFRVVGEAFMQGAAGQKRISTEFVKNFPIPTPTLEDQTAIASFLDNKTAKIDKLIEKDKKLIALLKEKRTALTNHVVTKGLDQNVKLEDSGIDWMGKIPEGWEVRKLKYISYINKEKLDDNTNPNFKLNYLDISNVDSEGNIFQIEEQYFEDAPSRARRIPKENDTIISTVRTYLKAIAYLEKIPKSLIVSTGFAVLEAFKKIIPKYLFYAVTTEKFIQKVIADSKGVAYPAINPSELGQIYVIIPPKPEQHQIVQYLNKAASKIDKTIQKIERKIKLLEEYKKSLIHYVVTGKVGVRVGEV